MNEVGSIDKAVKTAKEFSGKKIIVTGGSGGIGSAIAKSFLQAGADVCVVGSNNEKLLKFTASLAEYSNHLSHVVCDLSDKTQTGSLINKAADLLGSIDVLVCNAGVTHDGLLLRMNDDQWQRVIDVNLTSTFILNRDVAKLMTKQRSGRIINITSIVAFSGNAGQANYVASKAGMVGLTKTVAREVASRGVTANCIAPGFIETSMTDVLSDKIKESAIGAIPLRKMGKPEDIAAAALYLAGNGGSYVTGSTLHVNGGLYM